MSGLMQRENKSNTFSKLQKVRTRLKNLYIISKMKGNCEVKKFQPDFRDEGNTYLSQFAEKTYFDEDKNKSYS